MHKEIKIFTDLFVRFFQPVIAAASTASNAKELILQLGYVPPEQFTVFDSLRTRVNGIRDVIEAMATLTEEDIEADPQLLVDTLKNGVESISGLIEDIKNISTIIQSELNGSDLLAQTDILESLPLKLYDLLTIRFLKEHHNRIYSALTLFGIIDVKEIHQVSNGFYYPHLERTFHWDKLVELITSPIALLKTALKDNDGYFYEKILQALQEVGFSIGVVPHYKDPDANVLKFVNNDPLIDNWPGFKDLEILRFPIIPQQVDSLGVDIYPLINKADSRIKGLVSVLRLDPGEKVFAISDKLKLEIEIDGVANGLGIALDENDNFQFLADLFDSPQNLADSIQFDFKASLTRNNDAATDDDDKLLQIGTATGNRLEVGSFKLTFGVAKQQNTRLYLETELLDGFIRMKFDEADGFISKIIGKGIESHFSFGIGFSNDNGFYFAGSSGLEIDLPVHISLGPIEILNLSVGVKSKDEKITFTFACSVLVSIGPLKLLVRNIGVTFPTKSDTAAFVPNVTFKPPSGVGITVDAGGIKGGGILDFDPDNEEYFGALELEFKDLFSLKAFGIINTRMPDGSKSFSLLIIVTAEFSPVQLGLGFTLNGIGGLLGANRTTKVEVLKEGVKTNTLKSILFPEDVVANIDRIVSDIKQVFPPQADHFLICPMGKIGWGTPTIITLELGILIEIPATGFMILGVLKTLLPEEKNPLLRLQVNFLGIIDFENKYISFDASLYDSKILTFTLTGDMALRLGFGDKPVFLLSVGGFHPSFKDVPGDLKNMRRLTISLYDGSDARIIIQTYMAVTSNTAQFGARAELFAQKGGFNINGFVGYDVLFQFSPFKFIAEFGASVALRRHSSLIMSIHVSGQLSGPKPWDARGEASVSFFFFSISVPFHVTWGDSNDEAGKQTEDLLALLEGAINDNRNWVAGIPANNKIHVSIRSIPEIAMAVHPFGILTFSERLVPLEIEISKFGNKLPQDARRFEIKVDDANLKTEEAREQFAPANFFEMKDDEKLGRPSFEQMKSGFKITGSSQLSAPAHIVNKVVDYEFSYLGKKRKVKPDRYVYPGRFFKAQTKSSAVSQSPMSHHNNRVSINAPEKITVREEQYVIANISDMKLHSSELVAASYTEALQYYHQLIARQPELKDKVQVLSDYELNLV
ncbi:MAG TPA: DUF6603 domain-containing protein [Chryseolinea sp.]|nr:DUF6603 domain-containing protein [Chryseolinea sp.]